MYSLKAQKKEKSWYLRKKNIFFIICISFSVTIYYVNLRYVSDLVGTLVCHYDDEGDVLPWVEDPNFSPKPNSIFFHETSCSGGLNSRQACSIESAARAHPTRQVYVLFSGPIIEIVYQRSCVAILRLLTNVNFARVHIQEYAKNTPLDGLVVSKKFKESKYRIEHTSDVLRFLTLYKWGGVYLDTDIMVVESLTPLGHNWVAKEDKEIVNTAAVAISTDHLGRRLAKAILNEVKRTYRSDAFTYNGPGAMMRVLQRMCNTYDPKKWSAKTCQGLAVYDPEYFFPVHYTRYPDYFTANAMLSNVSNAFTHHLWNKITYNKTIEKDSPYDEMAQKLCPLIYEMYGDEFGT